MLLPPASPAAFQVAASKPSASDEPPDPSWLSIFDRLNVAWSLGKVTLNEARAFLQEHYRGGTLTQSAIEQLAVEVQAIIANGTNAES